MGLSASSYIFFGIYLGDNDGDEAPAIVRDEDNIFDDLITIQLAPQLKRPTGKYKDDRIAWNAYFDTRRAVLKKCPVDLIHGGNHHRGYSTYSLALKFTLTGAHTYRPTDITEESILKNAWDHKMWSDLIKKWCGYLGLPWEHVEKLNPKGPRWYVVNSYG